MKGKAAGQRGGSYQTFKIKKIFSNSRGTDTDANQMITQIWGFPNLPALTP